MSEAKKINANAAVNVALAGAVRGTELASSKVRALSDAHAEKLSQLKDKASPVVSKLSQATEILYTILGFVLIIHGSQFQHLFLCYQVINEFCFGRVKGSVVSLYNDMTTALGKMDEGDSATETKDDASENKHAQKRQAKKDADKSGDKTADVAKAKKVLKIVDSDKVTGAVFEVCVAFMACHMTMEGGLAKVAIVTHVLVKTTKDKIKSFLDMSEHEDLSTWLDLILSFVLYSFFGGMALFIRPLAFAFNLGVVGASLVVAHGGELAKKQGKIPEGESVEAFAGSMKGLAIFAGLAAFGAFWQFWAIMAESSVAWYFQMFYFPAFLAESIVSLL